MIQKMSAGRYERFPHSKGALTGLGSTVSAKIPHASGVLMVTTSPAVNATIAWEGSIDSTDGVNGRWFPVFASATNSGSLYGQAATASLSGDVTVGHVLRTIGMKYIRCRASAWTSGTNVQVEIVPFNGPI